MARISINGTIFFQAEDDVTEGEARELLNKIVDNLVLGLTTEDDRITIAAFGIVAEDGEEQ